MPAKSKDQQKFFLAVLECKLHGKCTPEIREVAKNMSVDDIKKFTKR